MPKREDIKSILIIGAGPIVIGQACEFDYSGAQACKALREEDYRVILVNSNPATIMTDPKMADATYIEPIEWRTLEKIIEKDDEQEYRPSSRDFGYAYFRDELKAQKDCNPDITIEMEGKDHNPHERKYQDANDKYLGQDHGKDNLTSYSDQWDKEYELDLIGREYCRDRQIGCDQKEFAILMTWQQAKSKLIMAHTKWIETILEQCKVLNGGLRDHVYLEQSIDMAKKMGLTISETNIFATTSKGIVVSNTDILNHLASLKNKTQTRDQKIALRKIYDQQQAK